MDDTLQLQKIVLQSTGKKDNLNLLVGGCLMILLALAAFFYWHSLGGTILFIIFGVACFVAFLIPSKYSLLTIENGFLRHDGGVEAAYEVDTINIKGIQKIIISYGYLRGIGRPFFKLLNSEGKMFEFDIFNLEKQDLISLGQALSAAPVIQNSKEVQGLLQGDIVQSFVALSRNKMHKFLFVTFCVVILIGIVALIYNWLM